MATHRYARDAEPEPNGQGVVMPPDQIFLQERNCSCQSQGINRNRNC
jgi:hypothetical protein